MRGREPYNRGMRGETGFTLIETLVGLLILAFVLTTSLAIFTERQRRLRSADELVIVCQALANEAEVERVVPFSSLTPGSTSFRSDTAILAGLQGAQSSVEISVGKDGARLVAMTVTWNDGARSESLSIVRVNAGAKGSFW